MLKQNGTIIDTLTPTELAITDFSLKTGLLRLLKGEPTRAFLDIWPSITGENDHVFITPVDSMCGYIGEFLTGIRSCPKNYKVRGAEINNDPVCQALGITYEDRYQERFRNAA